MTIIHMEESDIITKKHKVPNKLFKGDGELQAFWLAGHHIPQVWVNCYKERYKEVLASLQN